MLHNGHRLRMPENKPGGGTEESGGRGTTGNVGVLRSILGAICNSFVSLCCGGACVYKGASCI
jgi:hypothetical protein